MPIPFIILAVAYVLGGAAAGAAVLVGVDLIHEAWKGKRLAVLGGRRVGKTVLITYLTSGELVTDYDQSTEVLPTVGNTLRMADLSLRIKKSQDVPGDQVDYPQWKKIHVESDVTLYLFRADQVLAGNADEIQRIEDDLGLIKSWENGKKRLFLIGTHCDLDPEYREY